MKALMYVVPLLLVLGVLLVSYPKAVLLILASYAALMVCRGQFRRRPRF
jgi:hypothetical protein